MRKRDDWIMNIGFIIVFIRNIFLPLNKIGAGIMVVIACIYYNSARYILWQYKDK